MTISERAFKQTTKIDFDKQLYTRIDDNLRQARFVKKDFFLVFFFTTFSFLSE